MTKQRIEAQVELSREKLNECIEGFVLFNGSNLIEDTIAAAGLENKDIEYILLEGGCTRIPLIKKRLTEAFQDD